MPTIETINEAVAAEIRAELGRQKMTQQQLAIQLQWNPRLLSRRLSGETAWTLEEVAEIARVLQMPATQLAFPRAA